MTSPWLTGFDTPPFWRTTQDPLGLGLIAALWIKEVPFLCWVAATQLQREDVRRRWQAEFAVAQTMGLTPTAAFNAVVWPQLARVLRWPFIAVLAYGLTVVDLALIIGPTAPPTLAVLAWEWLRDADAVLQAQGVLAAWVLAGLTLLVGASSWRPIIRIAPFGVMGRAIDGGWRLLFMLYAAAWLALLVGGFLGVWPFPNVRPEQWHMGHWGHCGDARGGSAKSLPGPRAVRGVTSARDRRRVGSNARGRAGGDGRPRASVGEKLLHRCRDGPQGRPSCTRVTP